jgi:hypothetical protein
MPGPHAATNNPSRTECISEAVSGVAPSEGVLVDGGFARTHAVFDGDALITDYAVARVQGVIAGPIRIHNLETILKMEYPLEGDPVISYALTIAGVEANGEPVANLGGNGLVLAGQEVAARDLIDQFNAEVAKAGATLQKEAVADYIKLVAPTVEEESDGGVTVTAPAVEVGHTNTFRQGEGGDHMGLRLGYASAYAILTPLEGVSLEAPTAEGLTEMPLDPPTEAELTPSPGDTGPLTAASGFDTGTTAGNLGLGDTSADLGGGFSSGSAGFGSGYGSGAGDLTGGATDAALDTATSGAGSTGLGVTAVPAGQSASALQLAAAESARAAKNTANGLLGGILVLVGALVWVGGMTLAGKVGG